MDPNFSVLVGDERKDSCESNSENKGGKGVNGALIGGLIGGILGFIILSVLVIFVIYPRLRLWRQTRGVKLNSDTSVKSDVTSVEMIEIEKRQNMETTTSAGHFVVRY